MTRRVARAEKVGGVMKGGMQGANMTVQEGRGYGGKPWMVALSGGWAENVLGPQVEGERGHEGGPWLCKEGRRE